MQPLSAKPARRRLETVYLAMGACLLTLGVLTLGACGSPSSGVIPCENSSDCPNGLTCDVEAGVCIDPETDDPYDCSPPLPGCACTSNSAPITCIHPDAEPGLVGSCRQGTSICTDGYYGACEVQPNPYCSQVGVSDFGSGGESDQVVIGPEGELVLDPDVKQVDFGFLWVANTGENTVSKLDIETGEEVARYASVRDSDAHGVPGVPIGGYDGDESNCGNCPSRTAIDFKGDAFVANRAFGRQGTVTKFANSFDDCVDHNGNGVIDTSVDLNNDGRIDVDDPNEFLGEDDECILWTAPVGGGDGIPRGLAIDAGGPDGENGNLWVGLYGEGRVVQLSGDTGEPVMLGGQPVSVTMDDGNGDMQPYGNAVDGNGNLWVTGLDDGDVTYLAKINTYQATLTALYPIPDDDDGCSRSYGIAIDVEQRIWLGGWNCRDLKYFDQESETWERVDFDNLSNTRGVAVDTSGHAWVAFTNGQVGKVRMEDVATLGNAAPVELFDMPELAGIDNGPIDNTIGVGIDRNGACWAVSRNDDADLGTATRIDVNGNIEAFPVGHRPYTYSDFTGFGLVTVVRPNGYWRGKLEGCATTDAITEWATLEWYENEPPGTSVRMRVRVADTVAELAQATWYGPWDTPPVDLAAAGVPASIFMEVEVQLSTTDPAITPSFQGFVVSFTCPGVPPVE
jgi:hypothetical protein